MKIFWEFFANIISLPGHRNKRKSVLEITKMYYFYIHIIKLLNMKGIKWLFSDLVAPCSLYRILTSSRIGNDDVIVIVYV